MKWNFETLRGQKLLHNLNSEAWTEVLMKETKLRSCQKRFSCSRICVYKAVYPAKTPVPCVITLYAALYMQANVANCWQREYSASWCWQLLQPIHSIWWVPAGCDWSSTSGGGNAIMPFFFNSLLLSFAQILNHCTWKSNHHPHEQVNFPGTCNPRNFRQRLIFVLFVNSWNLWKFIAY